MSTSSTSDTQNDEAKARSAWLPYATKELALKQAAEDAKERATAADDPLKRWAWQVQATRLDAEYKAAAKESKSVAERNGVLDDLNGRYVGETGRSDYRDRQSTVFAGKEFISEAEVSQEARALLSDAESRVSVFIEIRDNKSTAAMASGIAKAYRTTAAAEENPSEKARLNVAAEQNERRAAASTSAAGTAAAKAVADGGYSADDVKAAEAAGESQGQEMADGYIKREGLLTESDDRTRGSRREGKGSRTTPSGDPNDGGDKRSGGDCARRRPGICAALGDTNAPTDWLKPLLSHALDIVQEPFDIQLPALAAARADQRSR